MIQTLLINDGVEAAEHNKLLALQRLSNYEDSGTLWHFNVQIMTCCRQPVYDKLDSALPCLNKLEIPCCKHCWSLGPAKQVKVVWLKISYDHKSETEIPFSLHAACWMFSCRVNISSFCPYILFRFQPPSLDLTPWSCNFPGLLCGHSLAFINYESEDWKAKQFLPFTFTKGYSTIMVSKLCRMIHGQGRKVTIKSFFLVFTSLLGCFYFICLKHMTCKCRVCL